MQLTSPAFNQQQCHPHRIIFFAIMPAPSTTETMELNLRNFLEESHMTVEGNAMMKELVCISFSTFIPGFKVF